MATETQRHRGWNRITRTIIGAAVEVHRELGPGLLETVYEECLSWELESRAVLCRRQVSTPVSYKGRTLDAQYRIDLMVEDTIVVEIKAVEVLRPVHFAQLLSYLVLASKPIGLLINFNEARLVDGVTRIVARDVELPGSSASDPSRRSWIRTSENFG